MGTRKQRVTSESKTTNSSKTRRCDQSFRMEYSSMGRKSGIALSFKRLLKHVNCGYSLIQSGNFSFLSNVIG